MGKFSVKRIKGLSEKGRYGDGDNLYLCVGPGAPVRPARSTRTMDASLFAMGWRKRSRRRPRSGLRRQGRLRPERSARAFGVVRSRGGRRGLLDWLPPSLRPSNDVYRPNASQSRSRGPQSVSNLFSDRDRLLCSLRSLSHPSDAWTLAASAYVKAEFDISCVKYDVLSRSRGAKRTRLFRESSATS